MSRRNFLALRGFRDINDITGILKRLCPDGITALIPDAAAAAPFIRKLYVSLLCLPPDQKIRIIAETLENARQAAAKDPVCAWIHRLSQYYPEDIGILSPALMNLVTLTPGQALFLESGELHAYLCGMGIEIMANSDNVLRAGLTVKHVDTEELLDAARFDPGPLEILALQTVAPNESRYLVHAEEFVLSKIALKHEAAYAAPADRSVEILLCTGGTARLTHPELADEIILKPGDSVIIPAQTDPYHINGEACIYKAGVPI
jgi:mannose-6-phosphate isomerase